MKYSKHALIISTLGFSLLFSFLAVFSIGCWLSLHFYDGGFSRELSGTESHIRKQMVESAQHWLGTEEESERHEQIIQIYNTHEPLAQGYEVKISDNWCATFGSTVAIQTGRTDFIPTECSCGRQIDLWSGLGRWEEDDHYMPLPGDFIYYNWDQTWSMKDNTGWPDHVGIVVGTLGPVIKVIEGNKDDCVTYRIIFRWDHRIRGYGLPDYASIE